MTRQPNASNPSAKGQAVDPFEDPVGAFLVRQRPEVMNPTQPPRPGDAGERITDAATITSLLASVANMADASDDDLLFELLYLETLMAARPLKSQELLEQLGALGDEVRDGLLPPGMVNMVALRRRTQRLKQHLGGLPGRISAAIVMLFTTIPMFAQQAVAGVADHGDTHSKSFQIAAAPVVRVIDANTGTGLAGVTIKSMEEKVLGVTDGNGQATLSEDYRDTDLMSLEKNGYELSLLERSQLAARNIVSMKPIGNEPAVATKPVTRPAAPAKPAVVAARPTAPTKPTVQMKAPTAPHAAKTPQVAMGEHGPQLEAPQAPKAPSAPQIKLPTRPRPSAAALVARAHGAAKPAASPAPVMGALPTHPKPMQIAANAPTSENDAGPQMAAPKAPAAHAQHTMAKPQLPSMHLPTAPRQAAATHQAPAHQAPASHQASAAPNQMAAMSLPAHPRRPVQAAAPHTEAMPHEQVAVAVPKRVPRVGHGHAHHASWAPTASSGRSVYQVKPGDTLSTIAKRQLGSARRWPELYAMNRNRISNPRMIRAGQLISLPGAGGVNLAHGGRTYVVRPGDSLFRIASSQLGNASRWPMLYSLNRDHLRSARMIFPGQHITLPG